MRLHSNAQLSFLYLYFVYNNNKTQVMLNKLKVTYVLEQRVSHDKRGYSEKIK